MVHGMRKQFPAKKKKKIHWRKRKEIRWRYIDLKLWEKNDFESNCMGVCLWIPFYSHRRAFCITLQLWSNRFISAYYVRASVICWINDIRLHYGGHGGPHINHSFDDFCDCHWFGGYFMPPGSQINYKHLVVRKTILCCLSFRLLFIVRSTSNRGFPLK